MFGRWYKRRGDDDSTLGRSTETIDDGSCPGSTFSLRTIPPLPGMKVSERGVEVKEEVKEELDSDEAARKAEEAEVERQLEEAASVSPLTTSYISPSSLVQMYLLSPSLSPSSEGSTNCHGRWWWGYRRDGHISRPVQLRSSFRCR